MHCGFEIFCWYSLTSVACRHGRNIERLYKRWRCSIGTIELVGSDVAIYIEGNIHGQSILLRFAAPYSFGVFSQLGNT
jgi:hypothetical protein